MDEICHRHKFSGWSSKYSGEIASGSIDGEKVLLLKPMTFMNLSGQSVQGAASFYKIPPDAIYVFHDELDLLPGKMRVKKGGGSGGHNGIKSIDSHLGQDYWRVRMGIGHPGDKDMVSPYVLGDFSKGDQNWLEKFINSLSDNAALLAKGDTGNYMTKVALDTAPPKEEKIQKKEQKDGI